MIYPPTLPQLLQKRLAQALPGRAAQLKMAHPKRFADLKMYENLPENHKVAAVLALVFQKNQIWHTALIERVRHPNDRHSGQISFPGGKKEPHDPSLADTALRETEEEIGVDKQGMQLLGQLTNLYIPISNFLVQPYVAWLPEYPRFKLQVNEVAGVLTPPLFLFSERVGHRRIGDMDLGGGMKLPQMPYFEVENRKVWGATAMILSELAAILEDLVVGELEV